MFGEQSGGAQYQDGRGNHGSQRARSANHTQKPRGKGLAHHGQQREVAILGPRQDPGRRVTNKKEQRQR